MDCEQVREELDAHALGALSHREAADLEQHVAGCLSCWEELQKARETAALLTLTVPMHEAPPRLRANIIAQAQREMPRTPAPMGSPEKKGIFGRFGWGLATGFASFAAVGAIAFAALLQVQVNDLQSDNDSLEDQVASADDEIEEQSDAISVLAAADVEKVEMRPSVVRNNSSQVATYSWSRGQDRGYIYCQDMPVLAEGESFVVWLTYENADPAPIAQFWPTADKCQAAIDLQYSRARPKAIGVTKETDSSGDDPSLPWLLYAEFSYPPAD